MNNTVKYKTIECGKSHMIIRTLNGFFINISVTLSAVVISEFFLSTNDCYLFFKWFSEVQRHRFVCFFFGRKKELKILLVEEYGNGSIWARIESYFKLQWLHVQAKKSVSISVPRIVNEWMQRTRTNETKCSTIRHNQFIWLKPLTAKPSQRNNVERKKNSHRKNGTPSNGNSEGNVNDQKLLEL